MRQRDGRGGSSFLWEVDAFPPLSFCDLPPPFLAPLHRTQQLAELRLLNRLPEDESRERGAVFVLFPSASSSPLGDRAVGGAVYDAVVVLTLSVPSSIISSRGSSSSTATVADGSPPPRANDDDEPKGPGVQVSTRTPSFFCSLLDLYLRSEMVMLSHFYSKVWPICVWKRISGHAGSRTGHPTEGCYFLAPHLLSAVTAVMCPPMFDLCRPGAMAPKRPVAG